MKSLRIAFVIIISFLFVAACSNKSELERNKGQYSIVGIVVADSVLQDSAQVCFVDSTLLLFIDKHNKFVWEELPVLNGRFVYRGVTDDVDELFISDQKGNTVNVFAQGGAEIEMTVSTSGKEAFTGTDSLNIWYGQMVERFDNLSGTHKKSYIDTITDKFANTIVPALVIRDRMHILSDSVFLRQCLGRLEGEAKPVWLANVIEQQFDQSGIQLKKNVRLSPLPRFRTEVDSVYFDFKESRQNSVYIYFWAEYSSESVDSLQMLEPLAKQYGLESYLESFKSDEKHRPKRVNILTVCLNAKDSASWLADIKGLPGKHLLLQDGFSNPVLSSWKINRVPYNLIIDRFSNIQDSYQWGKDLRDAMERTPNNYSTQNGSKNNNSRSSRH